MFAGLGPLVALLESWRSGGTKRTVGVSGRKIEKYDRFCDYKGTRSFYLSNSDKSPEDEMDHTNDHG